MESLDVDCVSFKKKWTAIFEVREALLSSGVLTYRGECMFRTGVVTLADEKPDHSVKLLELARHAKLPLASYQQLEKFVRSAVDGSSVTGDNTLAEYSSGKKGSTVEEDSKEKMSKDSDVGKSGDGSKAMAAEETSNAKSGTSNENPGTTEVKRQQQHNMKAIRMYQEARDCVMTSHQVAHLSSDDSQIVYLTSVNDLRDFYVRNTKFDKQLANLERDITEFVEETRSYFSTSSFQPEEPGRLCIGRIPLPVGVDYNVEDSYQKFAYKRVQLRRQINHQEQQQVCKK